jgi:hypothetical protein
MPYHVIKEGRGYYVENKITHKKYSKHPLSKAVAEKQMKAIEISEFGKKRFV